MTTATIAHADPASTSPQQGYDLGEVQTPRSLAMGGALNASGTSTTALYLNPASLTNTSAYHIEAIGSFSPEARRTNLGGAIADSQTSKLAGALGANWSWLDPDGARRQWTDIRVALAFPLADQIAIGLAGRYLRLSQSVANGPFGNSLVSDGTRDDAVFNKFTFDAGVTIKPITGLYLGVVGHNLTNPGSSFAPTTLAGGVGFMKENLFAVEANGLADFTTWKGTRGRFMTGGEVVLVDHVPLRAGYRYDAGTQTHAVSGGLGFKDKKWAVEAGVRRDVAGDHPMTLFSISLRVTIDPKLDDAKDEGFGMDQNNGPGGGP